MTAQIADPALPDRTNFCRTVLTKRPAESGGLAPFATPLRAGGITIVFSASRGSNGLSRTRGLSEPNNEQGQGAVRQIPRQECQGI